MQRLCMHTTYRLGRLRHTTHAHKRHFLPPSGDNTSLSSLLLTPALIPPSYELDPRHLPVRRKDSSNV